MQDTPTLQVVALFAFAARLGQYCLEHDMEDLVTDVAACLSSIAIEKINPFVREQGGWVRSRAEGYIL